MKTSLLILCFSAVVYCQTQNKNGNPTGEIGQPAFDEIVVESTLTVRGKSGSRSGKSLITNSNQKEPTAEELKSQPTTANVASVELKRNRRMAKQRFGGFTNQNLDKFPQGTLGNFFPSTGSSGAQASSNAFNTNTPFGSFGASASQSSTYSQNFGPFGFQGSSGNTASQTYNLPNGCKIDLSFSNSFSFDQGNPSSSSGYSLTITDPDGKVHTVSG